MLCALALNHTEVRRYQHVFGRGALADGRDRRLRGVGGGTCSCEIVVGLTAQRLTRAARAHVPKPERRSACTHVSRAMQAARAAVQILISRGGSAAGPKPGRASFCGELGRVEFRPPTQDGARMASPPRAGV